MSARQPISRFRRTEPASDAALIASVLDGDADRYGELIQRYQVMLFRYALGMVLDPDAAADLVQDAFIKAYTSLDRCRDPSRFGVWIFQVLRNRCLDYLKNRRRKNVSLDDQQHLPAEDGGPEADLGRAELRTALEHALARLPEAQREAFVLKHVHEYSYEEMAEMLDASVSALKMRVLRARELLQTLLAEDHVTAQGRL